MTSAGATPPQDALTEQTVKSELDELASKTQTLDVVATLAALGGLTLGAIAAIPLGPLAFLMGSVVGAAVAFGARWYARSRKELLREEISSLRENEGISKQKAEALTTKVERLYTDNPEQQKVPSH